MALLLRSTLAQSFCMSAAQAVRSLARASGFGCSGAACCCSSGVATVTRAPSLRRPKPVVTTRSALSMPLAITACVSV